MKRNKISMMLLSSIFLLVSCNGVTEGSTNPSDDNTDSTENSTEEVTFPKSIIIYTNQTSGGRQTKLENLVKTANFPFGVTFVELSGQTLKGRLIAEKESPMADVVLGGGVLEHIDLKSNDILRPFTPTWIEDVDEKYLNEGNYYLPWAIEPLYVVYNKDFYTTNPSEVKENKKLAPTSWNDMATNFKNEYNVFKPSSSTGSVFYYAAILAQNKDTKGQYNVSKNGWSLLEKVINNGIMDQGLWQYNLTQKGKSISMAWAGAIVEVENQLGVDLDVLDFEEGTPVTVAQIGVVNSKNAGRIKAAEMFVEWWGQANTQETWAKVSGQAPTNNIAFEVMDERIKTLSNPAKPLDIDWEFVAANATNWREKIELDIYY